MQIMDERVGGKPAGGADGSRSGGGPRPAALDMVAGGSPLTIRGGTVTDDPDQAGQRAAGEVGIHWLQGSFPAQAVDQVRDLVASFFPVAEWEDQDKGFHLYDRAAELQPVGVHVFTDSTRERSESMHGGRACLRVPGEACDRLAGDEWLALLRGLAAVAGWRCTRVDVAWDDHERIIAPWQVAEWAERKAFIGYRVWEHRAPRKWDGERLGDQVNFGRRGEDGGGEFLRIYDKRLESEGVIDAVRWEVEFSKAHADRVGQSLARCETVEAFAALMGMCVGASIEFRIYEGTHGHRMRGERPEFWERIVERLGKVKMRIKRAKRSLEQTKEWIELSVASSLRMVQDAIGEEDCWAWLGQVVQDAQLREHHRAKVLDYVSNPNGWPSWARAG